MAANSQLYDTISEIVRDYHANQFEILTFSRIDVQDEIENHFGLETQCDKHGNVIDVLQFSDGAGYGLWLQKFTFPTHYSMEEHLKEAMCNVLFFDGEREEFLFHPRTQIRISSTAEIKKLISSYSDHLEAISDSWRKPLIDQQLPVDAPAVYLTIDDPWFKEWFFTITDHTVYLIYHYYAH